MWMAAGSDHQQLEKTSTAAQIGGDTVALAFFLRSEAILFLFQLFVRATSKVFGISWVSKDVFIDCT